MLVLPRYLIELAGIPEEKITPWNQRRFFPKKERTSSEKSKKKVKK